MDFRVLGPPVVVDGDREVALGTTREGVLLAILLVHADEPVSAARLIDDLWGGNPPAGALATLQGYVRNLRRALEPGRPAGEASGVLVTRRPGYVLLVGPDGTDATRFERLADEGRHALRAADAARADAVLRDALSLWRGPAFGDLAAEPFARVDAARLEERRLVAIEDRVEARLALGQHAQLVAELEALVSEHPLREPLWGQLMLALYRAGRQADALRAYGRLRTLLGEELGIEPATPLRELEEAILLQKPGLDWHPPAPGAMLPDRPPAFRHPASRPLPVALAADTQPLVGRRLDLEWLEVLWNRARDGEPQCAVLVGPHGIGKSRLAAEFARRAYALGARLSVDGPMPHGDDGPLLVVTEDASADGLAALGGAAMVVVTSLLSREGVEDLASAVAGPISVRELAGLGVDDVASILAASAGPVAGQLVSAVHAETDGVPARVLDVARAMRDHDAAERLQRALARAGEAAGERRAAEQVIAGSVLERARPYAEAGRGECPYKGLAAFGAGDAAGFFGRERLVATLVARLAVDHFVGVVGASGSGKSSVVCAGLLPALADGAVPGSEEWPVVVCTPGADPEGALARALATLGDGGPKLRRVLVVDQFEELVTQCRDRAVRASFLDAITRSIGNADGPLSVVAVLRADYYGAFAEHEDVARLFETSHVLVGAMNDAELRRAIVAPARLAGLVVEEPLVDAVCADAAGEPGALPLVSTAMLETWAQREGSTLTLAAYRQAGGVRGAIARSAEQVYAGFDDEERATARRLFMRLAEPGEGTDDVRRRAAQSELEPGRVLDTLVARRLLVASEGFVEVAHEALLREWPRLREWLVEDRDGRRLHRQLAEAAARWDADGRDPAGLYRGTRLDAALEWAATHDGDLNGLEREFLAASRAAQEAQLRAARRTARRFRSLAGVLAVVLALALVAGGLALAQRGRANHQAATARRAATAAEAARQASDAARQASDAARLGALARAEPSSQRDLAMLLAVEGRHLQESSTTDGALEAVLVNSPPGLDRVVAVAETPSCVFPSIDGRYLGAGNEDGSVHVVDAATGRLVRKVPNTIGYAGCPTLSFGYGDRHLIVAAPNNGKVAAFDVATGGQVGATIQVGPGYNLGYEPRPGRLVTSSPDGTVIVWDTTDPSRPARVATFAVPRGAGLWAWLALGDASHPDLLAVSPTGYTPVTQVWRISSRALAYPPLSGSFVAVSTDGSTLLLQSSAQYELYDVATGQPVGAPLAGVQAPIGDVGGAAFSPDGKTVAVADATTHRAVVIDLQTRRRVTSVPYGSGGIAGYLPDGRLELFDGETLSLVRTQAPSPAPFAVPLAEPGPYATSVLTPDGATALTTGTHGVHAWDAATGAARTAPVTSTVGLPTFSAHGRLAATPAAGATFTIADATTGRRLGEVAGATGATAAWSPRGTVLAVGAPGGEMTVWDLSVPARPAVVAHMAAAGFSWGGAPLPVFSPDGRLVAAVPPGTSAAVGGLYAFRPGGDGPVSVFDTATGRLSRTFQPDHGGAVASAAFSPDSHTLAVSVLDPTLSGRVLLWDAATGTTRATLRLPYAPFGVQFAAGGRWLVTSQLNPIGSGLGITSVVDVWDSATLARVGDQINVAGDAAFLSVDRPGGYRVATGTTNPFGSPLVIDLDPADWESSACHIAGRNLTRAEWGQFLPGRPYQVTCPQWPAGT